MTTPGGYRTVAGLNVPLPLVPRIVSAFRGTYPTLTAGLGDDDAVKAVLLYIVKTTLSAWEGSQAGLDLDPRLQQVRDDVAQAVLAAQDQALADADAIQIQPTAVPS